MRLSFFLIIFVIFGCGKQYEDGFMDCTNIKRSNGILKDQMEV